MARRRTRPSGSAIGVDLEVVHVDGLAGAVDVDAGFDGVGGAELAALALNLGVVGNFDVEQALTGAEAIEADAIFEPLGVAEGPGEDRGEVGLAAGGVDGFVDGPVEHEGREGGVLAGALAIGTARGGGWLGEIQLAGFGGDGVFGQS